MFCYKGIADITFKDEADESRFNELVTQFADNKDAAYEMLVREKLGEEISPDTSLFDRESQLIEDTLGGFDLKSDKDIERLQALNDKTRAQFEKRIKDLEKEANNLKAEDKQKRQETIDAIKNLLLYIDELDAKDQFNAIIDYALKNLTRSKEWLDSDKGFNPSNEAHRDTILALWKQLDTYAGLNVPEYAQKHSQLSSKINEVNSLYREVKEAVEAKFTDTVVDIIQANSTKQGKDGVLTRAEIEAYLRESNDIDGLQKWFIDMNSSSDTLLATIAKIYAYKREEINDLNKTWSEKINAAGRNLLKAGIQGFDWMAEKDSAGNKTGNIVQRVAGAFNKELQRLYENLNELEVGSDGKKVRREYIKKPLAQMSDDEIAHNIALSNDKADLSKFQRAEVWDKEEGFIDGENKKYKQDFKDARAEFETYNVDERQWEMSPGVSQASYDKHMKKYYGPLTTAYRMVSVKVDGVWEKTGEVEEYETRFVKSENTEVTDKWDSAEYKTIQANPAMKEFYDFYTTTFQEILDKMPADIAKKMQNRVLRIKSEFYSELLKKKTPVIKSVIQKIKGLLLPAIVTSSRKLDEQNMPINDVGIYYMSDLKNEKRVSELEAQINTLKNSQDLEDKKKVKALRNSLLIEQNKATAEELEYDLVESLIAGMDMANAYDIMKQVESTFHIAQEVIKNKGFYEMKPNSNEPVLVDGLPVMQTGTSNVEERLAGWMRMVFYNNSQVNDSKVAQLAMLLKKYTSLVSVGGLAVFPAFNNVVTAEMSNIIDGVGGRFYTNKNYVKSSKMVAKHLANPKWASHMFKPVGQYEEEKPYDLFTALVAEFNFLEENADTGLGIKQKQTLGKYIKSGNVLYALTEGGEYQAQTRTAVAYLDNKLVDVAEDFEYVDFEGVTKKTTDKKISLLDAYTFDEATQKLSLRPRVIYNSKARRETTGEIRNMNKNIHGNHSSVDKVLMQENWYGELAFQFKRWMPNGIRNRFANRYYDESLGMEMEGRYRAITTMIKNMEGMSMQFAKDAWNKLSTLEQANMKKNAAEAAMFATALALYVIFDAIREGVPPDDEYTRMALNFLKQQADKSSGELAFFVSPSQWYKQTQSPISGLRTFKEAAEFMSALTGVPYYGLTGRSEKLRYEKGVNKGDLKVWKEFRDLLPIFKQIGAFKQLDITGDFFIR